MKNLTTIVLSAFAIVAFIESWIHFHLTQAETSENVTRIGRTGQVHLLVLAYPRSGSSLLGDILSANPKSTYFFEPFAAYKDDTTRQFLDIEVATKRGLSYKVGRYLKSIFECHKDGISKIVDSHFFTRFKNVHLCPEADTVIIKEVKLHSTHFRSWLANSNIKVVHLIRDPRAIFNSMTNWMRARHAVGSTVLDHWIPTLENMTNFCETMQMDAIYLESEIPSNRYFRLKYEDLVTQPFDVVTLLNSKLQLPFDAHVNKSLKNHLFGEYREMDDIGQKRSPYMTTFMGPNHKANEWKTSLDSAAIRKVSTQCKETLEMLKYI